MSVPAPATTTTAHAQTRFPVPDDGTKAARRLPSMARRRAAWLLYPSGWIAGSAIQLQQASLSGTECVVAAALLALLTLTGVHGLPPRRGRRWRTRTRFVATAAVLLGTLAMGLAGWSVTEAASLARARHRMSPADPGDWVIEGTVASLVQPVQGLAGPGLRWTLDVDQAEPGGDGGAPAPAGAEWRPRRVELSWWGDGQPAAESVRPGQRWRLPVRLRPPHGLANRHGHDRELWLWEHGTGATGTVRERGHVRARLLRGSEGHWVDRARLATRERLRAQVRDAPLAGVLVALVSGEQAAIDATGWQLFRATGVAHLMSISGVNVTLRISEGRPLPRKHWVAMGGHVFRGHQDHPGWILWGG